MTSEAKILWTLLRVYTWTDRLDLAFAAGEQALAFAQNHQLKEQLAYITLDLVETNGMAGQMQPMLANAQQAVALWRELNNLPMYANSLMLNAAIQAILGHYDEALALGDEALAIDRLLDNRFGQVMSILPQVYVGLQKMAIGKALAATAESIDLAGKVNFVGGRILMTPLRSQLFLAVGAVRQAESCVEPLLEHVNENVLAGIFLGAVALVKLAAGDLVAADVVLQNSSFDPDKLPLHVPMLREKALIAQAIVHQDFDAALTMSETVLAFAQKGGMVWLMPDFHTLQGQALVGLGRSDEARAALHEALAKLRPTEHRWGFLKLLTFLADLEAAAEHEETADNLRLEARAFVDAIMEQISAELQASFFVLPEVVGLGFHN